MMSTADMIFPRTRHCLTRGWLLHTLPTLPNLHALLTLLTLLTLIPLLVNSAYSTFIPACLPCSPTLLFTFTCVRVHLFPSKPIKRRQKVVIICILLAPCHRCS